MRERKRLIAVLLMTALVLSILTGTGTEAKKKKKVKFNRTKITLTVGDEELLEIKNNTKSQKVKWKTSNKRIVSLEDKTKEDCYMVAKRTGTSIITAKIGKVKLKCKVQVKAKKASETNPVETPIEVTPRATASPIPTKTPTEAPKATASPTSTAGPLPTNTPVPTVNPQDIYDANYNKVVDYIIKNGTLQSNGRNIICGYTNYGVHTETDFDGSYLWLCDANGGIKLTKGKSIAELYYNLAFAYNIDIRTIKGDGTDTFDWESFSPILSLDVKANNAGVYNMLKAVNGSYRIAGVTLKELGFTSYVY